MFKNGNTVNFSQKGLCLTLAIEFPNEHDRKLYNTLRVFLCVPFLKLLLLLRSLNLRLSDFALMFITNILRKISCFSQLRSSFDTVQVLFFQLWCFRWASFLFNVKDNLLSPKQTFAANRSHFEMFLQVKISGNKQFSMIFLAFFRPQLITCRLNKTQF